ncbi:peptidylprolyl isomerase [Candidatus Micrarchaeota archaeon]|nr:peptidylprolyl isomerase [Candidatus Micrarchaeota archaeon]
MKEGDFVKIEYSGRSPAGKLIDTTNADEAKKEGIFNEKASYKPFLAVVGKGQLLKGLDEALMEAEEGEEKTVIIPKEKAFGDRREELVKLVPLSQFRKQDIDPYPGMVLDLDGMRARVQSVSGGRVRVDFNHELAGQDLTYWFKVLRKFVSPEEKVNALAEENLGVSATLQEETARVAVGEAVQKESQEYILGKLRFIEWTQKYIPEVKNVVIEEAYAVQKKEEAIKPSSP